MIAYLFAALCIAIYVFARAAVRPRVVRVQLPRPRTWADFCRDPRPMVAIDIPLRSGERHDDRATVYNHAAALLRMRGGR